MSQANPWPEAARRLAGRVNRRARLGAVLARVGPGVLAGGLCAVIARLLGAPDATLLLLVGGGTAAGALLGWQHAFAVRPVTPGAAAWALDRVGERGEHGLAAATGSAQVAQQAARVAQQPPGVRMLPPHGLAWVAAGLLAAGVAWVAPGPTEAAHEVAQDGGDATARAARGTDAAAAGGTRQERLADVAKVRAALNLPPDGALNREALVQQLADPDARNRALEAAGKGPVADRLQQGDNSAEALAQALLDADQAARAAARSQRRREAQAHAQGSLGAGAPSRIPAHRRGVVKRYLERLTN